MLCPDLLLLVRDGAIKTKKSKSVGSQKTPVNSTVVKTNANSPTIVA